MPVLPSLLFTSRPLLPPLSPLLSSPALKSAPDAGDAFEGVPAAGGRAPPSPLGLLPPASPTALPRLQGPGWGGRSGAPHAGSGPGRRRPLCSLEGRPSCRDLAHARGKRFAAGSSEGRPAAAERSPLRRSCSRARGLRAVTLGRAVRGCHPGGGPVREDGASAGGSASWLLEAGGAGPAPQCRERTGVNSSLGNPAACVEVETDRRVRVGSAPSGPGAVNCRT